MISPWWSIVLTLGDIAGHWIVGDMRRWGWLWNSAVEILWVVYSFATGQPGFIGMSVLHLVVFGRNYRRWGQPGHAHVHTHPHRTHDSTSTETGTGT